MSRVSLRSVVLLSAGLTVAASLAGAQESASAPEELAAVRAMQIVDCLLPGQVRMLGRRVYTTPRRPTRTTAADCGARGGEYLLYDRSDYRTALDVWLPAAEAGDAEAQTTVGEIYERGLGGAPNYEAAARWYRRAAESGHSRAQFNLGALYEQGLGVAQDRLEALNWYRRASGLSEDSFIFRSAAAAEREAVRSELLEQIEQRDDEIEELRSRIDALQQQLEGQARDTAAVRAELDSLRALLERLQSERTADARTLDALPAEGEPAADPGPFQRRDSVRFRRRDFGRYYALIIGVQEYEQLDDLASPANDIARIARTLEERYGFSVITLADPDQIGMMRAINELHATLQPNDNLLIYFSGHGSRLPSGARETGYWLPRNAELPPDDTFWVPNDFVTRHLGRIEAKRVLIVADSCYAGLLGDDPGFVMVGDRSYTDEYIEWKMPKRARLVLSSGGDRPVTRRSEQEHSIFARALVEELEANEQVLTAPELFLNVRQRVQRLAAELDVIQEPAFKAVRDAGHEVGDFFFVPTGG